MMGPRKPVGADAYDEEWIASAWGNSANTALLQGGEMQPRPRVSRAMQLAALQPGLRLLDIACGRGEVPILAATAGATSAVGIDFSASSIDYASRLRSVQRGDVASSVHLLRADACKLPFADASFDRITLLDIIEHLVPEQLAASFSEVRRLLAPGGYAVLHTLPNRWVYDITFPLLNKLWRRIPRDPRGERDRQVHVNEQDLPSLHRMLAGCGLQHKLWLEQHMPAQARWNRTDSFGDKRDQYYPMLAGPAGRLLEAASLTPIKLLLCNDIFGLAWRHGDTQAVASLPSPPLAATERFVLSLS